jgi:hypothetical protein
MSGTEPSEPRLPDDPDPTRRTPGFILTVSHEPPPSLFADFFHTADQPVRRPRSHRAPPKASVLASRLVAPATAVAVIVAVIVVVIWVNGASSPSVGTTTAGNALPASPIVPVGSPTAASSSPTTPVSSAPPGSAAAAGGHHSHRAGSSGSAAVAPVAVLNNSRITGLAHAAAATVQARGWTISQIGNLQGLVPETTVYYAAGDRRAARHLAHEFASIRRVEPNSEGNLAGTALTLVVTSDWQQ